MQRDKTVDIAKGIAIFLVVLGHAVTFQGRVFNLIFGFHMPLFFFLSGYCFYPEKYENLWKLMKHKAKTMLMPYAALVVLGIVVCALIPAWRSAFDDLRLLSIYVFYLTQPTQLQVGQAWFLVALFWTTIFSYIFIKCTRKLSGAVKVVLMLGIVYLANQINSLIKIGDMFRLPWKLDVAMMAMVFFLIGYEGRCGKLLDILRENWLYIMPILLCMTYYVSKANEYVNLCDCIYSDVWLYMIAACAGIGSVLGISLLLNKSKRLSGIVCLYGRNTMPVFGTHWMLLIGMVHLLNSILHTQYILQSTVPFVYCVIVSVVVMVLEIPVIMIRTKIKKN